MRIRICAKASASRNINPNCCSEKKLVFYKINPMSTISALKGKIKDRLNLDHDIELRYKNKVLLDERTLYSYRIDGCIETIV